MGLFTLPAGRYWRSPNTGSDRNVRISRIHAIVHNLSQRTPLFVYSYKCSIHSLRASTRRVVGRTHTRLGIRAAITYVVVHILGFTHLITFHRYTFHVLCSLCVHLLYLLININIFSVLVSLIRANFAYYCQRTVRFW